MSQSKIEKYFEELDEKIKIAYQISQKAKNQSLDPTDEVEIKLANNISQRVEGLISVIEPKILNSGISQRIEELEQKYSKLDWRVALEISKEVSQNKFINFKNQKEAIEIGIRVGLSYITLGIISAPLEGFVGIDIKKTDLGEDYISLIFAGPIRAAGGTAGAVCVLIADYIRKALNYADYDVKLDEVKRFITDIRDYNEKVTRLQYNPKDEEIEFLVKNIGVEIDGEPTENIEVSNYKNITRIKTNKLRGGMCLVLAECLTQKASKINKKIEQWGDEFNLKSWHFLDDFLKLQKRLKSNLKKKETNLKRVLPNYSFINEAVGGRPIFSFPMQKGGFRLRYGRSRISGFASYGISRESMFILNDFLATGTQLRVERPGKSTIVMPCDSLEKPIVKLKDNGKIKGRVIKINNIEEAKKYNNQIEEILHLGDLLISFGDFSENNHNLVPNGYCEEEWFLEFRDKLN